MFRYGFLYSSYKGYIVIEVLLSTRLNVGMAFGRVGFQHGRHGRSYYLVGIQCNNYSWLGTGFLVSFPLVLPIYHKLGDIFGWRNIGLCDSQ